MEPNSNGSYVSNKTIIIVFVFSVIFTSCPANSKADIIPDLTPVFEVKTTKEELPLKQSSFLEDIKKAPQKGSYSLSQEEVLPLSNHEYSFSQIEECPFYNLQTGENSAGENLGFNIINNKREQSKKPSEPITKVKYVKASLQTAESTLIKYLALTFILSLIFILERKGEDIWSFMMLGYLTAKG